MALTKEEVLDCVGDLEEMGFVKIKKNEVEITKKGGQYLDNFREEKPELWVLLYLDFLSEQEEWR